MELVPYDESWLPQLAALARCHARLTAPGLSLADEEVALGLREHAYWPFYTPGLASAEILLAVEEREVLAAAQVGFVQHGWGYGAVENDGPEWLRETHASLFWLMAWPGDRAAAEAAALLAARVVSTARNDGLPGLEAFRGGAGFLPFGTQLSSRWLHLFHPLRAAGFRQPRTMLVFGGEIDADALPAPAEERLELTFRGRRGRVEAWLGGEPVGICAAAPLAPASRADVGSDPRSSEWCIIRRLVVDVEARRRGVGTALLAEQLRRLQALGYRRYLLHVSDSQEELPARMLYWSFGRIVDSHYVLRVSF